MKLNYGRCLSIITLPFLLIISTTLFAISINLNSTSEGGNSAFSGELMDSSCSDTGVVMFHGRGSSPTGPIVMELSSSLNRAGYTTLSIDNPLPLNQQVDFNSYVYDINTDNYVFPESYARMRSAINYLQSLGVKKIVIAGFSLGSRLSTAHVARGQIDELPVIGLIGIGMYGTSIDPLNISFTLDEVNIPVLDLYGDADTNAVNTASSRLAAYNTGTGVSYIQSIIACINGLNCHQLEGNKGDDSKKFEIAINSWMQSFAPASVITSCDQTVTETTNRVSGGSLSLVFIGLLIIITALRLHKKIIKMHV